LGLDASDNLLIADTGNNRVRMVDASGTITTIAGNGEVGSTGDGGPATDAAVQGPWGLAVDASGNLFISSAQSVIRKVAPDGTISTYAGGQYGFAGDGGPATGASLAFPKGLAVDAAGNLYIADQSNDRVRVVSPQ
jgi:sugar lactone lactonase YvrE